MKKVNVVLDYYLSTEDDRKREAAESIKSLLAELDDKAEVVPENSFDMLRELILFLKGTGLTKDEIEVLELIANS